MNSRELTDHVNAVRKLLKQRRLKASDAATVAQWVVIGCGMDLLDNRHGRDLQAFVMTMAETGLRETLRAEFRVNKSIIERI